MDKKAKQHSDEVRRALYKSVFNTPDGEKIQRDLMLLCHMTEPTYQPGDSHDTAYREGMRAVMLQILHMTADRSDPLWINSQMDLAIQEQFDIREFE